MFYHLVPSSLKIPAVSAVASLTIEDLKILKIDLMSGVELDSVDVEDLDRLAVATSVNRKKVPTGVPHRGSHNAQTTGLTRLRKFRMHNATKTSDLLVGQLAHSQLVCVPGRGLDVMADHTLSTLFRLLLGVPLDDLLNFSVSERE